MQMFTKLVIRLITFNFKKLFLENKFLLEMQVVLMQQAERILPINQNKSDISVLDK